MLHAVIMAGGSGTRFWPESRATKPKQLLQLASDRSMIQMTLDRLESLVPVENVVVATGAKLVSAISQQLPQLPPGAFLSEPCKRDTAPCIGLAAFQVLRADPDATMLIMPADHVIPEEDRFRKAMAYGAELVRQDPTRLVTFGIKPTYAAEIFGYIERGAPLAQTNGDPPAFSVNRFREKPDATTARRFLDAGTFYWNAGIFIWKASTLLKELAEHAPELYDRLERIAEAMGEPEYSEVLEREFAAIEGTSIDYAVMEQADTVTVVEAPFAWDDVGSWQALSRLRGSDKSGNTVIGKHLGLDTCNTIIHGEHGHLIATMGISDCIVVHTPDATLIANRDQEEAIRKLVKRMEQTELATFL